MRIACIHIPQFALQSATRIDPALRGAAVAVVSGVEPGRETAGVLHAPIVLACSRLAWAQGVRLGMTATAARSQSSQVCLVTAHATNERETVRAIADALPVTRKINAWESRWPLGTYESIDASKLSASIRERLREALAMTQADYAALLARRDEVRATYARTAGRYHKGMATFTIAKGGLMYEASVGGQKFKYKPA